ncbi:MAG TPA: hypothetical protein PLP42_04260 [Acidobacteriota bacterium]|nr:hypothetical protein [Acidobacteriota bacterium]
MKQQMRFYAFVAVSIALLLAVLAAQANPEPSAKERWLRVIETEMELAPQMTRTFRPRRYQFVEIVMGAGEFSRTTSGSFARRTTPSGDISTLRLDTSDNDFLILAIGGPDNLGVWRNRVVHYIPWDRIVDIYFENSPVAGGVVR